MLSVIPAPSLAERTTLRIGGVALAEVTLTEAVDAWHLGEVCARWGGTPFVLGAGSNILAGDGELPLVLVRPQFRHRPLVVERDDATAMVRVGAGVRLPRLLSCCASWGLSGLEGLCGIPGTVGGAVAMNAGSFGCETARCLHALRIYSPRLGIMDISRENIVFSYRNFTIQGLDDWFMIIQAIFILTLSSRNGITESMRRDFFKKKSTQPVLSRSAGCVFKNPSLDMPAGRLLEQAGFKGRRLGGMAFSALHANFLINEGGGSAAAAFDLVESAREAVRRRFGVTLEPEVRILS